MSGSTNTIEAVGSSVSAELSVGLKSNSEDDAAISWLWFWARDRWPRVMRRPKARGIMSGDKDKGLRI